MPEGDTVHQTARRLQQLDGQLLTRTDFRVPQHATVDLSGGTLVETVARGKHLLTRIDAAGGLWTLHTHLKMEGAWRIFRAGQSWRRPAHQARVVLHTAKAQAVGFSLGVVELLPTVQEDDVVGHLGPDLLGPGWDPDEALRRLRSDPGRPLGEALLDQRNLSGIGNIYHCEVCFVSGLHPATPIGTVERLPRLVTRARQMLQLNLPGGTRTTTGDTRAPLWVYGRDGQPCRRCRTTIRMAELGPSGRERQTYWCPHCQPAPTP